MKENYIKQVRRELHVPRKQKNDILRDLEEAFSSAVEHGETEQQIIQRLGTPRDFAVNTEEQLGINRSAVKMHRQSLLIVVLIVISVLAFVLFAVLQAQQLPADVIGGADAMTSIQLVGGSMINPAAILLGVGIAAVLSLLVLVVKMISKRKT